MLNTEQIISVFQGSPTAEAVGEYISNRQRHRGDTSLTRVVAVLNAKGHKVRMGEVETIFRHMDALGLGKLKHRTVGRKLFKVFQWDTNPVVIAEMIKHRSINIEHAKSTSPPSTDHIITLFVNSKYRIETHSPEDAAAVLKLME